MLLVLYHLGLEIATGLLVCAILALVLLSTGNKEIWRFLLLKRRYLQPRLGDEWGAPHSQCRQWHLHSVSPPSEAGSCLWPGESHPESHC